MFNFNVTFTPQIAPTQPIQPPEAPCSKPHWAPIGFEEAAQLMIAARRLESAQDMVVFLGKRGIALCREDPSK
jgi:hypothetical protein